MSKPRPDPRPFGALLAGGAVATAVAVTDWPPSGLIGAAGLILAALGGLSKATTA